MLERKCVKICRSLQYCNGVTRFEQVENQSRNHASRKKKLAVNACWERKFALCVYRLQHPTTSYTGL